MGQKHLNQKEIIAKEKSYTNTIKKDVEYLELLVRKNECEISLMGLAIGERTRAFAEIEANCMFFSPDLVPAVIQARNMFASQATYELRKHDLKGWDEKSYCAIRDQYFDGMKKQSNPSEQLHAVHDELQKREKDDLEVKQEAEAVNTPDTSDEPPFPEL